MCEIRMPSLSHLFANVEAMVKAEANVDFLGRGLNRLQWDHKEGRRAALGGSDFPLYIYDIGGMALPRETEWADLQRVIAGMVGGGQADGAVDDPSKIINGR
ncbi:hypothetical protein H1R20_g6648, partial [Candolleomyces eurysporus]